MVTGCAGFVARFQYFSGNMLTVTDVAKVVRLHRVKLGAPWILHEPLGPRAQAWLNLDCGLATIC
ncbi:MAG TPA: hypothetical protein DCS87_10710 [Rheinheimera sp.]|nr:hypothetical protein [Rheinheimera sp.]